jgi:proteic killer suppression protein
MIKSFADRETQALYATGKTKRLPPDIQKRAYDVEVCDYH